VLLHVCRLVYEEYDFALYKENLNLVRVDSEICKTKYPVVMVHGILFRDLKYFNYWGRIPRELIRNGAKIYYGNQEAVGTIAYNAEDIKKKIIEIIDKEKCEKVNIIAHSKGGLDARYAISVLGIGDKVASLTTINTPHRGCIFVDKACCIPEKIYRFVAKIFDSAFRRIGDKNPDFYSATHQFTTASSAKFNQSVCDVKGVYYQSYMSRMKNMLSDPVLCVTYYIIKKLEGENDGLVSISSAIWGNFRGVFESATKKGISHGDMIDLKRTDYRGFDTVEFYVKIVAELKNMGF
jgi:triacylglycerol lipase